MAAFIRLWGDFHKKSSDRLKEVYPGDKEDLELIIWNRNSSYEKYGFDIQELHQNNQGNQFAFQIWTDGSDVEVGIFECGAKHVPLCGIYLNAGFIHQDTGRQGL